MKNILFVMESICISVAVFGICIFDSNCIAGAVLLLGFGSGLAVCIRVEEWYGSRCMEYGECQGRRREPDETQDAKKTDQGTEKAYEQC